LPDSGESNDEMYRPEVNISIDSALTISRLACKHAFDTSNIEIAGSYAGWLAIFFYGFDHFEVSDLAEKNANPQTGLQI
jgi:hypothetical protein